MPGDLEGAPPDHQPAELTWVEVKSRVAVRMHHQRGRIAAFLTHFRDAIRTPKHEQRLDHTPVKQEDDPKDRQAYPQRLLPGINQVETRSHHVHDSRGYGDNREHDMGEMPCLVLEI